MHDGITVVTLPTKARRRRSGVPQALRPSPDVTTPLQAAKRRNEAFIFVSQYVRTEAAISVKARSRLLVYAAGAVGSQFARQG